MDTLTERVAGEIRAEMGRQRLSGRALAKRVGKPTTTVNRWVSCTTPLTIDDMELLSRALRVRVQDIVARAADPVLEASVRREGLEPPTRWLRAILSRLGHKLRRQPKPSIIPPLVVISRPNESIAA